MTWNLIVANLVTNYYVWDTTQYNDGNSYLIKIIVTDGIDNYFDTSNNAFSITNNEGSGTTSDSSSSVIFSTSGYGVVFSISTLVLISSYILRKRKIT